MPTRMFGRMARVARHLGEKAVAAYVGRIEEARKEVQAALDALPNLSLSYLAKALPPKHPGGLDPYLDALLAAGLPE